MHFTQANTPQSRTQLINQSLRLYWTSLPRVFVLGLVLSVIVFIPRWLSLIYGTQFLNDLPPSSPHRLWMFILDLLALMFFTTLIARVENVIKEAHERVRDDLTLSIHKLPQIFLAVLLQGILAMLLVFTFTAIQWFLIQQKIAITKNLLTMFVVISPFLLELLFLLYISILFIMYIPLIALENEGPVQALGRSAQLVWRNWASVFSVQIFPWFCYLLILIIVKYGFGIPLNLYFVQLDHFNWVSTAMHVILFGTFVPWIAATMLVQLHDLELRHLAKIRKERAES